MVNSYCDNSLGNNKAAEFVLVIYVLFYLFGINIFAEHLGILTLIKFFLIILFTLLLHRGEINRSVFAKKILQFSCLFVFLQFIFVGFASFSGGVKLLINVIIFYLISKRKDSAGMLDSVTNILKISTIISCAASILVAVREGVISVSRGEMIDKCMLTFLFSVSICFSLIDIVNRKKVLFNSMVLLMALGCNMLLIQSKITFMSVLIFMVVYFINSNKKARTNLIKYASIFLAIGIVVFSTYDLEIPLPMQFAVNKLLGFSLFDINVSSALEDHLSITYDTRNDIKDFCFGLFEENPILGVGLGNYANIVSKSGKYFSDITDTESSWLGILCEGGILYIFLMLYFFVKSIFISIRVYKVSNDNRALVSIYFFIIYAFIMLGNDFLDSMFWILSAVMWSFLNSKDYEKSIC